MLISSDFVSLKKKIIINLITFCPASNEEDNINKWYYLINGTYGRFDCKVKLVERNDNDSSAQVDLGKAKIETNKLILVAGEERTATMVLYSINGKRWNYWYPSIGETIKIKLKRWKLFTNKVLKGEKSGIYKITAAYTKKLIVILSEPL